MPCSPWTDTHKDTNTNFAFSPLRWIKGSDSLRVEVGAPDPAVRTFPSVSATFLFHPDLDGTDGSLSEEPKTAAEDEKSNLWLKTGCSPLDGALWAACDWGTLDEVIPVCVVECSAPGGASWVACVWGTLEGIVLAAVDCWLSEAGVSWCDDDTSKNCFTEPCDVDGTLWPRSWLPAIITSSSITVVFVTFLLFVGPGWATATSVSWQRRKGQVCLIVLIEFFTCNSKLSDMSGARMNNLMLIQLC